MITVVVIDDDADLRAMLRAALAPYGALLLEAGDAAGALALVAQVTPDVVVVDGALPDARGVELVAQLRARDERLPLVFISGVVRDLATFAHLTIELRVALVAYKPLDPASFVKRLIALAARPVVAAPARAALAPPRPDFEAELAALRASFAARLPTRLAELVHAIEVARADANAVSAARTLAHRLAGSAGSYGHAAVGEAIGAVERILEAAAAEPRRRVALLGHGLAEPLRVAHARIAEAAAAPERRP